MQDKQHIVYSSKQLTGRVLTKSSYKQELMALVLTVQHWHPYLLGRHFVVRTDQCSLKYLLLPPLTTLVQQNWAAKLLGYNFEVFYKEAVNNKATDALSYRDEEFELVSMLTSCQRDWTSLQAAGRVDVDLAKVISDLEVGQPSLKHFTWKNNTLLYKGRLVVPRGSQWVPKLLHEFHVTGNAGALHTCKRLAAFIYWPSMIQFFILFVAECDVCKKIKYETKTLAGFLNPLSILSQVWENISIDFIMGLLRLEGWTASQWLSTGFRSMGTLWGCDGDEIAMAILIDYNHELIGKLVFNVINLISYHLLYLCNQCQSFLI